MTGLNGIALGSNATAGRNSTNGIAIGNYVTSNAANSYVFGMGSSSASLTNSKPNSIMFGVTDNPTLTIWQPQGAALGYLGINTDTPEEQVHVMGKLLIETTDEISSGLQFKHTKNSKDIGLPNEPPGPYTPSYYWDIYSNADGLIFKTITKNGIIIATSQKMIMSRNGNVGIGVATPLAKLDVSGSFQATSANVTGALTAQSAKITNALSAQSATIADTLKANTLSAQSANITKTVTTAILSVTQDATINNLLTANTLTVNQHATINGIITMQNAQINNLLCAAEVRVKSVPCWSDFVFAKDYKLPALNDVEQFITENQHLPNVPSAAEVKENGIDVGEMNAILLQKVEELTLYIIELQKQMNELKNRKP